MMHMHHYTTYIEAFIQKQALTPTSLIEAAISQNSPKLTRTNQGKIAKTTSNKDQTLGTNFILSTLEH